MTKKKKIEVEPAKLFEGKEVEYLDNAHGFYRYGTCYKEENGYCWVRDKAGKKHKTHINSVKLLVSG